MGRDGKGILEERDGEWLFIGKESSDFKIIFKVFWEICCRLYFVFYFKGYGIKKECEF